MGLGLGLRARIRRALSKVLAGLFDGFARSDFGWQYVCPYAACLYYIIDGSFLWEQRTVLQASRTHRRSLDTLLFSLRRSIHRIEKGLSMRERREHWASDYIGEAVDITARLVHSYIDGNTTFADDVRWSYHSLSEYFRVAHGTPAIEAARARFNSLAVPAELNVSSSQSVAHPKEDVYPFEVDDLLALARNRQSVREYLSKPVPRTFIDRAIAVALESPSACNRQAFSLHVFDDPGLVRKVAAIPIGIDEARQEIPCIVVFVGKLGAYPNPRDRHLIYIDCSLAAMAFVYALQVQGIASCCVNWPDIPRLEREMGELLGLSSTERPVMLVSLGYADPDGLVPISSKRGLEEMRTYNRLRRQV